MPQCIKYIMEYFDEYYISSSINIRSHKIMHDSVTKLFVTDVAAKCLVLRLISQSAT